MRSLPFYSHITLMALAAGNLHAADEAYPIAPETQRQPGVPRGALERFSFAASKIFPGTTRYYWVYIPAQYDAAQPACVYVNQDGIQNNAPIVFDNLIARKEMPVTVGVFIVPGVVKAPDDQSLDRYNRSFEYDSVGGDYTRFLLEELLPDVETKTTSDGKPIRLSKHGNDRAIGGSSSGAVCAFTAAWERPDAFTRVFSAIGTYVGLRGADQYPTLIRKFEPKPIRVFLQDGSNDLNIYGGDWWMANQTMERALKFAGYDVEHIWGEGGHNGGHAAAVFPEALRWLWRDWPKPIKPGESQNAFLKEILIPDAGWQLVAGDLESAEGTAANAKGEIFLVDAGKSRPLRIASDGSLAELAAGPQTDGDQAFGPDGRRYALAHHGQQIVACDHAGQATVIADGLQGCHLVVRHDGLIYVSQWGEDDESTGRIWLIKPNGNKPIAQEGPEFANGITLSPDQSLVYVSDAESRWISSYQIQPDGLLRHGQRYFCLHLPEGAGSSGGGGLCCDQEGRLYAATAMGIQICDQAGRVECILPTPNGQVTDLAFGGDNFDTLFAACGDRVFKRKLRVHGALPFERPFKPSPPKL
jgi:gluconolactonase